MEALIECGAPAEAWALARNQGGSLPLHCAVKVGASASCGLQAASRPAEVVGSRVYNREHAAGSWQ